MSADRTLLRPLRGDLEASLLFLCRQVSRPSTCGESSEDTACLAHGETGERDPLGERHCELLIIDRRAEAAAQQRPDVTDLHLLAIHDQAT